MAPGNISDSRVHPQWLVGIRESLSFVINEVAHMEMLLLRMTGTTHIDVHADRTAYDWQLQSITSRLHMVKETAELFLKEVSYLMKKSQIGKP